ncbi:MAG: DUF4321 domain-containing protein [Faecalibacterium sp.]|nr:DUF4321 domain-containing protein [Faecalibacterium sp.]
MKKTFWFLFWLLAGLIVGSLLANACAGVPALSWLAYGQSLNFAPSASMIILDFSLNVTFRLNLAQIICVLVAMFCSRNFKF